MIILVDFENTHVGGFDGYEYLNDADTLVVYYSDENSAVTRGMVEDLKQRNVNVRMVKLLKQHSNALDMYIASTTGMFLDLGEKICIVSKDKGYAAVRDFWHSLRGAEILLGETIEECFLHSVANDDERIRKAKERNQKALLTEAFETMNKIPTRPTLSRANYRRRRNDILDVNRNLEPVEILPNPLIKQNGEEPAAGRGAGQTTEKAPLSSGEAGQGRQEKEAPAAAAAEKVQETVRDSEGKAAVSPEQERRKPEKPAFSNPYAESSRVIVPEQPIGRVIPRLNPNQEKFVYDPVTRQMKRLGAAPEEARETEPVKAEEKTDRPMEKDISEKKSERPLGKTESAMAENEGLEKRGAEKREPQKKDSERKDLQKKGVEKNSKKNVSETKDSETKVPEKNLEKNNSEKNASETKDSGRAAAQGAAAAERNGRKDEAGQSAAEKKSENKQNGGRKNGRMRQAEKKTAEKQAPAEAKVNPPEPGSGDKADAKKAEPSNAKGKAEKKAEPVKPKDKTDEKKSGQETGAEDKSAETKNAGIQAEPEKAAAARPEYNAAEILSKYGASCGTLHQYYLRLMKAFGRENGRVIYDETKKSLQAELKKRKAAKASAEAAAAAEKAQTGAAASATSAEAGDGGETALENGEKN